jgi:uncharacterized protein with von Willebrand factor type A (vWA) domain
MDEYFSHNLLLFARLLRSAGLSVSPEQASDFMRIAGIVGVARREDFYYAARALFVRRHVDLPIFDRAFELFFSIRGKPPQSVIDPTQKPVRRTFKPKGTQQMKERELRGDPLTKGPSEPDAPDTEKILTYTPLEILRLKNFDQFTLEEISEARRLVAEMDWQIGKRRTRRKSRAPHGTQIDLNRVIRRNLKYGTELFRLPEREPKFKMRPLVVLADISGSMERYTRMVLHLLHALSQEMNRVEVFTFGTRLTRITPDLKRRSVESALARASRRVPDWSGGTRIGEALKTFNFKWARRVLRAGAVVLIISDGWDRGDLLLLRDEMARLQRSCFRLIWLNPLLGAPSFEPTAQGMQVAMAFVDDFLPVHNVVSLEALVERLSSLEGPRPLRQQQPRVVIPSIELPEVRRTMELPQMGTSNYVRRTMTLRPLEGVPTVMYEENPDSN